MKAKQDTTKTQLERATEALRSLSKDISEDDRKEAVIAVGVNARTIVTYITEYKGRNLDTAVKLLQFFRKRIEDREKLISC